MRLVAWNIRAGGGSRWPELAAQIQRWSADVAVLSEFRATPPSRCLSDALCEAGLVQQQTTADPRHRAGNALLLASRWPLRRLRLRIAPKEPGRWRAVEVDGPGPFVLGGLHAPNMVTGRKMPYLEAVERLARSWRRGPAVFVGDTNCGWPEIDEERPVFNRATEAWLESLATLGWRDAFRLLHPEERRYTWYSPNGGNGFRLDQAFVNRSMQQYLAETRYEWGQPAGIESTRRDALSDHAALLLDLDL